MLSKMLVLLLFAVGFMAVGGLVNLAVLLFQGWEPVGFWTLFGVGIEEGLIMCCLLYTSKVLPEGTPSYSLQPTADEREVVSTPVRDCLLYTSRCV